MAENDLTENYDVRTPPGFLTPIDDPTVGGAGHPYAGIGNGQLPVELRHIGEQMRLKLFPNTL
jgi:hypothetical protein